MTIMVTHPKIVWDKFLKSYGIFWQPIKNYGILFVDLFCVKREIAALDIFDILKALLKMPPQEQQLIMKGPYVPGALVTLVKPAHFYTIEVFSHALLFINIFLIHIVAPLVCLFIFICYVLRKSIGIWEHTYVFCFTLYWLCCDSI